MKILILSICLFTAYTSLAQTNPKFEQILKQKRTEITQIEVAPSKSTSLVPSTFAENDVAFKKSVDELKELTIIKVYYVYTKYRQSSSFNQLNLDRKRFERLNAAFPELISDPYVEWEIIEQTACTSPEMGSTYFHGFVMIHRPILSEKERLAEISRLENYLKNPTDIFVQEKIDLIDSQLHPTGGSSTNSTLIPDQEAHYKDGPDAMLTYLKHALRTDEIALKRDDQWVKTKITVAKTGQISKVELVDEQPERVKNTVIEAITMMPNWEPARRDSIALDSELMLEIRVSYSTSVNGMYLINGQRPSLESNPLYEKPSDLIQLYDGASPQEIFMKQAPVYKGLDLMDRNEKCALVMDVTGSMTEHVAAMKRWVLSHNDSVKFTSFTFFNDGDGIPSRKKKIGETGGIYSTFDVGAINNVVTETMRRGSGGERPENDVEAMLFAQTRDTTFDAILLIGDNYSEVRDIELFKKIKKKVNVLICSTKTSIRPEYLMMAKKSGGYFLYNGEYIDLKNVLKGQILSIGSCQYDYDGENFEVRATIESTTRLDRTATPE